MGTRLTTMLTLVTALPVLAGCATTTSKPSGPQSQSMMEKFNAGLKSETAKLTSLVSPKPNVNSDPSPVPKGKVTPRSHVAIAQMEERVGNDDKAVDQYERALKLDPNYLDALLGYARLEDRRNNLEAATKLYQRAAKKYPKDAPVHNDLGLCYHRRGMLKDATKQLELAVELRGDSKLYRNNLAAVLVEQGKSKEALAQLVKAHGEPVAHYNLAYLLMQKHKDAEALDHFKLAVQKDPSLTAANAWIAKLSAGQSNRLAVDENLGNHVVRRERPAANVAPMPNDPRVAPQVVQANGGVTYGGPQPPQGPMPPAAAPMAAPPQTAQGPAAPIR